MRRRSIRDMEISGPPPPPPPGPQRANRLAAGILLILLGVFGTPVAALAVLLSANACGAFGDGCEDYGKPADSFVPSLLALGLCAVAFVAGVVLVVASRRR